MTMEKFAKFIETTGTDIELQGKDLSKYCAIINSEKDTKEFIKRNISLNKIIQKEEC